MADSPDAFGAFAAFFERASTPIRTAAFFVILWPIWMIAAAMLVRPYVAQTLVPIVALAPLAVGICFFIIGLIPEALRLARHPAGRVGFAWLSLTIGVELLIGIYSAAVPLSNDTGLVPFLVLIGLAMFFLRFGGAASVIIKTLALAIIVITVIFLLGGRQQATTTFHSLENKIEDSGQEITEQGQTNIPCEIGREIHCENFGGSSFNIKLKLTPTNFSKMIYLPPVCQSGWKFVPVGDPSPPFTILFADGATVGPYSIESYHPIGDHPLAFKIKWQGTGLITCGSPGAKATDLTDIDGDPTPISPSPVLQNGAAAPPNIETAGPPQPRPLTPEFMKRQGDFLIAFKGCERIPAEIVCLGTITNTAQVPLTFRFNTDQAPMSYIIDDLGERFNDQKAGFINLAAGAAEAASATPSPDEQLLPNLRRNFVLTFINVPDAASTIAIGLRCLATAQNASTDWTFVTFANLPIPSPLQSTSLTPAATSISGRAPVIDALSNKANSPSNGPQNNQGWRRFSKKPSPPPPAATQR